MNARPRISDALESLLYDECENAIKQARFGQIDNIIARRYLLERVAQIDIAAEIGYTRSAVSRRMPYIMERLEEVAGRLGYLD
ncbi:MAG: hypothetical protein LUE22_06510 [Oscillospiraceae bacterium]|nr:hypothetical protein [Oscillospiraceae bacterium]